MNNIHPDTVAEIMKALDEGVSVDALVRKFPDHRAAIEEVEETRQLLARAASAIPEPITKPLGARLPQVGGSVESPFVINSLFLSMNYKIILPVLVLGLVVVGGTVFFSGKGGHIAETPTKTTPSKVAANASVDDVLAGFSADAASDQMAYADDGVSADMFAQSELSGFDSDTYDY
ncbi:hypothetical protein L0Y34_00440 [Candidatus Parcubacteria bacterium]|nr:hypothetical protein [Candidatus Parcubacteria bacterium]